MKLIKISDTHYIVVDNSLEFNENHYYYDFLQKTIRQGSDNHVTGGYKQKITHSTQPIEPSIKSNKHDSPNEFVLIIPISLSEIEEVIYGYSTEKMALMKGMGNIAYQEGYLEGFKSHQELTKGKLFTLEETIKIYNRGARNGGRAATKVAHGGELNFITFEEDEAVKSLLPKTEWDIEIDEQGKIKLI